MARYIDEKRDLTVSLKLPIALLKRMDEKQNQDHITRTKLIITAIESYLECGMTSAEQQIIAGNERIESMLVEMKNETERTNDVISNLSRTIANLTETKK